MNYVRKLGFEETPDYDFLRELFTKVLKTLGEPEDGVFAWMLLNGGKGWEASNVRRLFSSSALVIITETSSQHTSPGASTPHRDREHRRDREHARQSAKSGPSRPPRHLDSPSPSSPGRSA